MNTRKNHTKQPVSLKKTLARQKPCLHYLPSAIYHGPIQVALAGVGGNGSNALTDLARMNHILKDIGHVGLDVHAFDDDKVTAPNIGRQLFSPWELGDNKAVALTTRINAFFKLKWHASPQKFDMELFSRYSSHPINNAIVITCVDTVEARIQILQAIARYIDERPHRGSTTHTIYNLDIGNLRSIGQAIIGTIGDPVIQPLTERVKTAERLPTVLDIFPDMADPEDIETPSCSIADSIRQQGPFINKIVTTLAMDLLWHAITKGHLKNNGVFVNMENHQMTALPVSRKWPRKTAQKTKEKAL